MLYKTCKDYQSTSIAHANPLQNIKVTWGRVFPACLTWIDAG